MPGRIIERAARAAYGEETGEDGAERNKTAGAGAREDGQPPKEKHRKQTEAEQDEIRKVPSPRILHQKEARKKKEITFCVGDSVMVYPDKKTGIVCRKANDKGVLQVQLPGKKIWISHKRVKLLVASESLYPEDYDFSIIFDTVENRKLRHQMERKYVEGKEIRSEG